MAQSTLALTFNQSQKTVLCAGVIAVRETVTVTVKSGGALISEGLTLKIQDRSNNGNTTPIALFPLTGNSWKRVTALGVEAVDGINAQCDLVLNTTEAIEAFENCGNLGQRPFNILLYTVTTNALDANGIITIMNWPSAVTTEPITLDQQATINTLTGFINDLTDANVALTARVVELEAQATLTPVFSDFAALDFSDLSTNAKRNDALRALLTKLQGN